MLVQRFFGLCKFLLYAFSHIFLNVYYKFNGLAFCMPYATQTANYSKTSHIMHLKLDSVSTLSTSIQMQKEMPSHLFTQKKKKTGEAGGII